MSRTVLVPALTLLLLLIVSPQIDAQRFAVTYVDHNAGRLIGQRSISRERRDNTILQSDFAGLNQRIVATPERLIGSLHTQEATYFVDYRASENLVYFGVALSDGSEVATSPILPTNLFLNLPGVTIIPGLGTGTLLWSDGNILSSDLEGQGLATVYGKFGGLAGCARWFEDGLLANRLLVRDGGARQILSMDLDGGNQTIVATTVGFSSSSCNVSDSAVENLFWIDDFGVDLRTVKASGGTPTTLLTELDNASTPLFDGVNDKLIWAESDKIRRSNPDGTTLQTLHENLPGRPSITYLDEAGETMYWVVSGETWRSDLNGDNAELLFDVFFLSSYE